MGKVMIAAIVGIVVGACSTKCVEFRRCCGILKAFYCCEKMHPENKNNNKANALHVIIPTGQTTSTASLPAINETQLLQHNIVIGARQEQVRESQPLVAIVQQEQSEEKKDIEPTPEELDPLVANGDAMHKDLPA